MIDQTTIDFVKDLSIQDVIGPYLELKKSGTILKCCCPFHTEKTPSFSVDAKRGLFKCFGCGEGGDAISFIMKKENLPFYEAIKFIASNHGIEVTETNGQVKTPEQKQDHDQMLELLQYAKNKYRDDLAGHTDGLKYLKERGLTDETITDWQLGICKGWDVLAPDIISKGHYRLAEAVSLVKTGNGKTYDFLHNRIVIPLADENGLLIGLAGRALPGKTDSAKYFNPGDSPVYNKSKILFGLDKARKSLGKGAFLVEGFLDVIRMHQHGQSNTVGTCGTALTDAQAKKLRRYTDTVTIMRDGDGAGQKALIRDIPILLAKQFTIYVCPMPENQDPDSIWNLDESEALKIISCKIDAVQYLVKEFFKGADSPAAKADAIEKTAELLSLITSEVRRDQYVKTLAAQFSVKPAEITKPIARLLQANEEQEKKKINAAKNGDDALPDWVDQKLLQVNGFVQLAQHEKGYKAGIYFYEPKDKLLYRVTNFTIKPLYHIYEQSNNRRLLEVDNTERNSIVEIPSAAMVNQGQFETELMNRGNYRCEANFNKFHFKRLVGYLSDSMATAYELKTLGWQPEGFFAYSNAVLHDGNLLQYDQLGMVKIQDRHFMSLGNSRIHSDERQSENPYENDLFLKYVQPRESINFQRWATLFNTVYGENSPYGIAFVFLTLFKDLASRIAKMPLLYAYGPKGSGKSALAESIAWLFFSGKDADGKLIQGFNLNPGQSTHFSFFNRIERFRNCPVLLNEFDENTIEHWKAGTMKAAYDGEGREVGDGTSGKSRKTRIQKVQGTIILVGQYLAVRDDAAISSRSIPCVFNLERLRKITKEQTDAFNQLRKEEEAGLSFILTELLRYRPEVEKTLRRNFTEIQIQLMAELKEEKQFVEARLINNYSIMLAATRSLIDLGITLPYSFDDFHRKAKAKMINQNQSLKDNSIVSGFWKTLEVLFDNGLSEQRGQRLHVESGREFTISRFPNGIALKKGNVREVEPVKCNVLLLRFSNAYAIYAKHSRDRSGQAVQGEETLLTYLKQQPFYIGLAIREQFLDKRTSAHCFDYDELKEVMGIELEKNSDPTVKSPEESHQLAIPANNDGMPHSWLTHKYGFEK